MTQWLGVLDALSEDLTSNSNIGKESMTFLASEDQVLSPAFQTPSTCGIQIYMQMKHTEAYY